MNRHIGCLLMFSIIWATSCLNTSVSKIVVSNISEIYQKDTCLTESKRILLDRILENPPIGMDTSIVIACFGEPLHKRFFKDDTYVYVYFYGGHPKYKECPYSDLFCVEFDKRGRLSANFIYFILDNEKATQFWHAENLPKVSKEIESYLSVFYR